MKAEIGKRYVQLRAEGGQRVCHWKFDATSLPEWADGAFEFVDITGMTPEPDEGDFYDGLTFSKPVVPAPAPVVKQPGAPELIRALLKKGAITQAEIDAELGQ